VRNLTCLTVLAAFPFAAGVSQIQQNGGLPGVERNSSGMPGLPENANPHPDALRALRDSMQIQENRKRMMLLNVMRQKEMTSDTEKLLQLANEVKADTNRTTRDQLSMIEVRKVEMIEKLAHAVREKMKASFTP
jgi:hypothetical protein